MYICIDIEIEINLRYMCRERDIYIYITSYIRCKPRITFYYCILEPRFEYRTASPIKGWRQLPILVRLKLPSRKLSCIFIFTSFTPTLISSFSSILSYGCPLQDLVKQRTRVTRTYQILLALLVLQCQAKPAILSAAAWLPLEVFNNAKMVSSWYYVRAQLKLWDDYWKARHCFDHQANHSNLAVPHLPSWNSHLYGSRQESRTTPRALPYSLATSPLSKLCEDWIL